MPIHSLPLSVGVQNNELMLWCLVETDNVSVPAEVHIHGTGHPVSEFAKGGNYVGRATLGPLEFHIFVQA